MRSGVYVLVLSVIALSSCLRGRKSAEKLDPEKAAGWHRARLATDDGEVPFFLYLPRPSSQDEAIVKNGEESISIPVKWSDDEVLLGFTLWDSEIRAHWDEQGALSGRWESRLDVIRDAWPLQSEKIGEPDPKMRFVPTHREHVGAEVDVTGTWKLEFAKFGVAKGEFTQEASGVVTGTVVVPGFGDLRYLAGNTIGRRVLLSSFDGVHAFLVAAEADAENRTLRGTCAYPGQWKESFVGTRGAEVGIDRLGQVALKPGYKTISMPELETPRYRGKAVIVLLFASWCPSCADAISELGRLYGANRDRGLEVLGVAYEVGGSGAQTSGRIARLKKHYDVPWEIKVVRGSEDELDALTPRELTPLDELPVTIFLDRDHAVRAIWTGFVSAAAGPDHREQSARFKTMLDEVLRPSAGK